MMPRPNGYLTGRPERFGYGVYFLGQNFFYFIVATYLLPYYTDIGITAAAVTMILFVSKLWDAVNDPIFGGLMDKIRFKNAKFLPWLRISLPFITISTILIFAVPSGISLSLKIIWSLAAYILYDVFYTMCDAPIYGLVTTLTTNQKERTSLMTFARYFGIAGGAVVGLLVPILRKPLGGWLPLAIIVSGAAFLTMLPVCFTAKERAAPSQAEKGYTFREMLGYLLRNKYLLIFNAALFLRSLFNVGDAFGMYFARYCLGDESKLGIMNLVGIPAGILMFVVFPFLSRKFDKFRLFFWSIILMALSGFLVFMVGYDNFTLFLILRALNSVTWTIWSLLLFMFTPDCAEYGAYKTGINASGIAFSIQTFTAKLTAAISAALAGAALVIIGFIEGEGAVQLPGFEFKLWLLYGLGPVAGALIMLPVLAFYKLRDHDVQLMARVNAGEMTREEAEAAFSGKF
jgi:probable glucitol transport protein GutA